MIFDTEIFALFAAFLASARRMALGNLWRHTRHFYPSSGKFALHTRHVECRKEALRRSVGLCVHTPTHVSCSFRGLLADPDV